MTITAALVLFSVIWFMVFFIMLQIHTPSQAEVGNVVPGTPSSAPADAQIGRKALRTTLIAAVLFAIIAGVILSGWITVADLDFFKRTTPVDGE